LSILKEEAGAQRWQAKLEQAAQEGSLCVCPVVFAEISPGCDSATDLLGVLRRLGIDYDPISPEAAWIAGQVFLNYRKLGGSRETLIPDFLIAAHAQTQCDRLAATDRGYLRRYFANLKLLTM
jgi:predicted nucleic acid-binding protein